MSDPVIVNSSVAGTQISAGARQLVVLLAGAALSHLLPKETVAVLLSNDVINSVLGLFGAAALVWGQLHTRATKQTLIDAANAAPDSKFKVAE